MGMKEKQENKRDLERTKNKILHAATAEFAENGLKGARVDAIAKRAKINKAMIYYIFGGKEDLHMAALKHIIETKTRPLHTMLSHRTVEPESLFEIINRYFDDIEELMEYSRIILDDISTGAKALQQLKAESPDLFNLLNDISDILKNFMNAGEMYPMDPDITVMAGLMLMVSFTCLRPYMNIMAGKGSEAHTNLSDPEKWRDFMVTLLTRVFTPAP
jgi:AcrR family transcriptional regulator